MNALFFAVAMSVSAAVFGADLTIAGLRLGQRVPSTLCEGAGSSIVIVSRFTCMASMHRFDGDYWRASIVLARDQVPAVMSSNRLTAYVKGDELVGVDLHTAGLQTQTMVLRALVDKYGPPQTQSTVPRQNKVGTRFDVILATWVPEDGPSVRFYGAIGRVDAGLISIDLPAAAAAREAERSYLDRVAPSPPL